MKLLPGRLRFIILIIALISALGFVFLLISNKTTAPDKTAKDSSANLATYEKQGIKFKYPLKWRILTKEDKEKLGSQFIDILFEDESQVFMGLKKITVKDPSSSNLQEVASGLDEMLPKNFKGFEKIDAQVIKLGDFDALEYVFTFKKANLMMKQRLLTAIVKSQVYYINFWGETQNIDEEEKEIDNIIKTIEF